MFVDIGEEGSRKGRGAECWLIISLKREREGHDLSRKGVPGSLASAMMVVSFSRSLSLERAPSAFAVRSSTRIAPALCSAPERRAASSAPAWERDRDLERDLPFFREGPVDCRYFCKWLCN